MLALADDLFNAQLARAIGYAPYGGADIGECLAVAKRITGVDLDLWFHEWLALAQLARARGDQARQNGQIASARSAYLQASNSYRTAGLFLMGVPLDPRLITSHQAQVETFQQGAALLDAPPTIIAIPYEGGAMPGHFFQLAGGEGPRPTMILTGGYDGTAEELYFANGVAALERGYNVLAFDGPGQGTMLIDRGVPMRPDWEAVIGPVVDFALTLPGVDPNRLVLMGLSLGGYLAPRAATVEHRLAACVSDCGPYDVYAAVVDRMPGPLAGQIGSDNRISRAVLTKVLTKVMNRPTQGWALRRNLLVHGATDPLPMIEELRAYSLRGREAMITCPTFVCSVEGDDLSARAAEFFAALTCPKRFVHFTIAEGAGGHCEPLARTLFHQRVFDWLASVLPPR